MAGQSLELCQLIYVFDSQIENSDLQKPHYIVIAC